MANLTSGFSVSTSALEPGVMQLRMAYYARHAETMISDELLKELKAAIKEFVKTDSGIREYIQAQLPLAVKELAFEEVIKSVKQAIREEMDAVKAS